MPIAGPEPRDAGLDVDGEGEHGRDQQGDGPTAGRELGQAVHPQHHAGRTDDAGDADPGGEQLEDQQGHPDREQRVGRRRGLATVCASWSTKASVEKRTVAA